MIKHASNNIYMYGQNLRRSTYVILTYIPYPRKIGSMGGAPYTGPRLGDGPMFEVSVSYLYAEECPWQVSYPASFII